ncbi:MAG: response regulator transcription factor [Bacteroidetes bacterium]|nr:response regulator transcription factor [Bacteroidota bacterium]
MKKIKIVLIEDNRLLRDGIAAMLKKQSDMNIAAAVGNGENVLPMIGKHKPDILLLDLGLSDQNSLHILKRVKKEVTKTKVIVMDLIPAQADVLDFVQAGVSGFILKDATIDDFLTTIRSIYEGAQILPPNLTGSLFSQIINQAVSDPNPSILRDSVSMTNRERQVIELIADGLTNKEIAQKLHLSPYTVKSHVHNILEKLALHTRVQIAKHAHISDNYNTAMDNTSLLD